MSESHTEVPEDVMQLAQLLLSMRTNLVQGQQPSVSASNLSPSFLPQSQPVSIVEPGSSNKAHSTATGHVNVQNYTSKQKPFQPPILIGKPSLVSSDELDISDSASVISNLSVISTTSKSLQAKVDLNLLKLESKLKQEEEEAKAALLVRQRANAIALAEARVRAYEELEAENQGQDLPISVDALGLDTPSTEVKPTGDNSLLPSVPMKNLRSPLINLPTVHNSVAGLPPQHQPLPFPQPAHYPDERFLPRPEFPKFDGNPLNYATFNENFVTHVESKVHDKKLLLCYLLQLCTDKVKREIHHFVNYGVNGYGWAKERLYREYGRPCIVATACEDVVKALGNVKPNDPEGLKSFGRALESTYITLEGLSYMGSLNSLDSIAMLVNKLPFYLRQRWIQHSAEIENQSGEVAGFSHFVQFVLKASEMANSVYGRKITSNSTGHAVKSTTSSRGNSKVSTYNTVVKVCKDNPNQCPFCTDKTHQLEACIKFRKLLPSERRSFVKSHRLCFRCLNPHHLAAQCKKQNCCLEEGCTGSWHHTLLHHNSKKNAPGSVAEQEAMGPGKNDVISCTAVSTCKQSGGVLDESATYLCVVPVKVSFEGREVHTYAFLDQGSTHTFCAAKLVKALGIHGECQPLSINTLLDSVKSHDNISCSLTLSSLEGSNPYLIKEVFSLEEIPVKPNAIPHREMLRNFPHLSDIDFPTVAGGTVTLLIGANCPELFCPSSVRSGKKGQPVAIETPFGFSLLGPSLSLSKGMNCSVNFANCRKADAIEQIKCLWETDFGDGTTVLDTPTSSEDRLAYNLMTESVKLVDGHYELPLLWRPNTPSLPCNYDTAKGRLKTLAKRFSRDPDLHQRYSDTIQTYLDEDYAQIIPADEVESDNTTWYLPHHPVFHPRKPDKLRVVFDCAAKHHGISLNDVLMQGPDMMNSLVGVLTRFRKERVAITADIEAMFHRVRCDPSHTDALRFLWWPKGDMSSTPRAHKMLVHLFGSVSSPSCAGFALRQAAIDFGKDFTPVISKMVSRNFYVDDFLTSVPSSEQGVDTMRQITELLSKAGFRLHKWLSNSTEVLENILPSEKSKSLQNHDLNGCTSERVLGVCWNVPDDTFHVDVDLPKKPFTRRGVLSTLHALYDPLGFAAPITLEPKLVLQRLCKLSMGWDDPLPADELATWKSWLSTLPEISKLKVPRCLRPREFDTRVEGELHHFCDASSTAYGSCSYLRIKNEKGDIHCSFIMGKSRLAPLKSVSIPRLELTAAVLAVKLDVLIRKELEFTGPSFFWTDSTAVLQCIRNSKKRFPVFVANRLATIERNTHMSAWRHVPSKLNIADLASRVMKPNALLESHWITGPEFLFSSPDQWPLDPTRLIRELPAELTVKSHAVQAKSVLSVAETNDVLQHFVCHFSDLFRLKGAIAWLSRFWSYLKHKISSSHVLPSGKLRPEELERAEISLVRYTQNQWFSKEISVLSSATSCSPQISLYLRKLNPFLSDGILRVGGRLGNASLRFDFKHPVILPPSAHFTSLVIRQYHLDAGHSGSSYTWALIRAKYWVIRGSSTVRKEVGNCYLCKRRNSKLNVQQMADLPDGRLAYDKPPFDQAGVDYFGPFIVRKGRSDVKRYACLFTCLTSRAVHIEVSDDLSTDSFLNVLRRFIARRGQPSCIHSDNGSNFVGAERTLRQLLQQMDEHKINNFLLSKCTRWKFNPPYASHMGGSWERMIRSARRIFNTLLRSQQLTDDLLHTFMTEVESILNSRPLLPVTMDPADEVLTPNHLLMGRNGPDPPPGLFTAKDCYAKRRWAQVQYLANQFWIRWVKEYMPNLQIRQKWFAKTKNVKIGDVVLIVEDSVSRSKWALGKVVQVFPDKKGLVRSVNILSKGTLIKRPITKTCPIVAC